MQENTALKFIRKPELLSMLGLSNSTLYNRINDGLLPPAISLGKRAVGYLAHEIDQVFAAMIAEATQEQIKALVKQLIEARKNDKRLKAFKLG